MRQSLLNFIFVIEKYILFYSSTTALCYYAMDFADEELHLEHLAVRFKLEETRDEFKKIFEQCQEELRKKGTPVKSDTPAASDAEKVSFRFNLKILLYLILSCCK